MFFHADELCRFWESQDAGAESETDSILAADEEGLGHLHMQASSPATNGVCLVLWSGNLMGRTSSAQQQGFRRFSTSSKAEWLYASCERL